MARKLKTIVKMINEEWDGYHAIINSSYSNTDRKPAGYRYITTVGKGRHGYKIEVYKDGILVFDHDSSETYRTNGEVEYWIHQTEKDLGL